MKWLRIPMLALLMCLHPMSSSAETSWTLASMEGYGNVAIQDVNGGGSKSFAGGAHWTPTLSFSEVAGIKFFVGPQLFKGTSASGSNIYVVANYLAALQLKFMSPVVINVGGGGGTDFRDAGVTRAQLLLGGEYNLKEKLLGLIDRASLNVFYGINSSDLWIFQYALGVTF